MFVTAKSIGAYDAPERVAVYDRSMDIMHPNRHKMIQVALDVVPFHRDDEFRVLDIGAGTGFFVKQCLHDYARATAVAIDGAPAMRDIALQRLGDAGSRMDYRIGDFRNIRELTQHGGPYDLAVSAYALHHLDAGEKKALVADVLAVLREGGWFLNADVIVGATEALERRFQDLRVAGIVDRAAGKDDRYCDPKTTRASLAAMEASEGDQPLTLDADLKVLSDAGLAGVSVFWMEYREAVTGGHKSR